VKAEDVTEMRRGLWLAVFRKLELEGNGTDMPGMDFLQRAKIVDDRLALLYGTKIQETVLHTTDDKEANVKVQRGAETLRRYKFVG